MKSNSTVIALLLGERSTRQSVLGAQRLVRDEDGTIVLEDVETVEDFDATARTTGCFRRGTPILDPESREVIGYEMEEVPPLHAMA
jgi:hypothetical protein